MDTVRKRAPFRIFSRLLLSVLVPLAVLQGLSLAALTTIARNFLQERADSEGLQHARRHAAQVEARFDRSYSTALAFAGALASPSVGPLLDNKEFLREFGFSSFLHNEDVMSLFAFFDPGIVVKDFKLYAWNRADGRLDFKEKFDYDPAVQPFYAEPRATGRPRVSAPYYWRYNENGFEYREVTITVPIVRGGTIIGIVGVDVTIDTIEAIAAADSGMPGGYSFLVSGDGITVYHPSPELVGRTLRELSKTRPVLAPAAERLAAGEPFSYEAENQFDGEPSMIHWVPFRPAGPDTLWYCGIVVPRASSNASVGRFSAAIGAAVAIGFLAYCVSLVLLSLRFSREVRAGVDRAGRLLRESLVPGSSVSLSVPDRESDFGSLFAGLDDAVKEMGQLWRRAVDSERNLNQLIDFLPDPTFAVDTERRVIAWNRAIERLTGTSKEEIIGKGKYAYGVAFYGEARPMLIDLALGDDPELHSRYSSVEREGDAVLAEVRVKRFAGGEDAALWGKAAPLYDEHGEVVGAIESVRDVTRQARDRESLEAAQARERRLSEELTKRVEDLGRLVAGLSHELNTPLAAIASSLGSVLGRSLDRFVDAVAFFAARPTEERSAIRSAMRAAAAEAESFNTVERRTRTASLEAELAAAWAGAGASRAEIRRRAEDLAELGAQAVADLPVAWSEPGAAGREATEAAATICETARLLVVSRVAADGAAATIRLLRLFADDSPSVAVSRVGIADQLEELAERENRKRRGRGPVALSIEARPFARGDPAALEQVWAELVDNALRATDGKGPVEIALREEGGRIAVTVSDAGPGIPPDIRDQLFRPFVSTRGAGEGVGLGLAAVGRVAERHGGTVSCSSVPGRTVFRVELPSV